MKILIVSILFLSACNQKSDYMIKLEKETQFKADSLKNERLSLERQIKLLEAKNK